ncbi:MAG: hypothetical protein ABEK50_03475 [bacterium]
MTVLDAIFMYLGMALPIIILFFVVPFVGLYLAFSLFRDDMELSPKDL